MFTLSRDQQQLVLQIQKTARAERQKQADILNVPTPTIRGAVSPRRRLRALFKRTFNRPNTAGEIKLASGGNPFMAMVQKVHAGELPLSQASPAVLQAAHRLMPRDSTARPARSEPKSEPKPETEPETKTAAAKPAAGLKQVQKSIAVATQARHDQLMAHRDQMKEHAVQTLEQAAAPQQDAQNLFVQAQTAAQKEMQKGRTQADKLIRKAQQEADKLRVSAETEKQRLALERESLHQKLDLEKATLAQQLKLQQQLGQAQVKLQVQAAQAEMAQAGNQGASSTLPPPAAQTPIVGGRLPGAPLTPEEAEAVKKGQPLPQ